MRFAPPRGARDATSARCWSPSRASSGTRFSPPTRTSGFSARASSSICAFRRASRASTARERSKRAPRRSSPEQILLITLPKVDRATQSSAWFSALERRRESRSPSTRSNATRFPRGSPRASLASASALPARRSPSSPTGARATSSRRSRKSKSSALLLPEGELDADAVERAVTDVARYDVFQLSEAWLARDAARALRIIDALEAEGEGMPLLLWQLGGGHPRAGGSAGGDGGRNPGGRGAAQRARLGKAAGGDGARGTARKAGNARRRSCRRSRGSTRSPRASAAATCGTSSARSR